MGRGIYFSAMGMLNNLAQLDAISNNLANVSNSGYKKDETMFKAMLKEEIVAYQSNEKKGLSPVKLLGKIEKASVLDEVKPILDQGPVEETNNPLDIAIDGKGFFKIQSGTSVFYSRNGEYKLDANGFIVNNSGHFLLDINNQPIRVNNGNLAISGDGTVVGTGTRIAIVDLQNPQKVGSNYMKGTEVQTQPNTYTLLQGFLEKSNVNALNEMVKMINVSRQFGILEKAVQTNDALDQKIIELVSRG